MWCAVSALRRIPGVTDAGAVSQTFRSRVEADMSRALNAVRALARVRRDSQVALLDWALVEQDFYFVLV
jgi:hypothetical protein